MNVELTWRLAPLQRDGLQDMRYNFVRWWEGLLEAWKRDQGNEHITLTVNILWEIWKAGNKKVFLEEMVEAGVVMGKAQMEWTEFIDAQNNETGKYRDQTSSWNCAKDWKLPNWGLVKINSDAAFSTGLNKTGIGIVARDWRRAILKLGQKLRKNQVNQWWRKLQQSEWQCWWHEKPNGKDVEFQSDCKGVVDVIIEENTQESRIAVILEDIERMRGLFDQCTFSFVNRTGNQSAHELAKFALSLVKYANGENLFLGGS